MAESHSQDDALNPFFGDDEEEELLNQRYPKEPSAAKAEESSEALELPALPEGVFPSSSQELPKLPWLGTSEEEAGQGFDPAEPAGGTHTGTLQRPEELYTADDEDSQLAAYRANAEARKKAAPGTNLSLHADEPAEVRVERLIARLEEERSAASKARAYEEDEEDEGWESTNLFAQDYDDDEGDGLKGFNLDSIIDGAIEVGASDIHLNAYDSVVYTVMSEIYRIPPYGVLDPDVTHRMYVSIVSHVLQETFTLSLELDTSYVVRRGKNKGRRLRLSVGKSEGAVSMVFRVISEQIPTVDELGINQTIRDWFAYPSGLILINGSTGTGKSTTLAALIREIQTTRRKKIITIEKPIEYTYGNLEPSKVVQRDVGRDTKSFGAALTSAMRQAPDIVLVGEVRNREEVEELLRASETGHLSISTMHTNSVPTTISRIRSLYQGDEQARVLGSFADNVRGLANQVLVRTRDGNGRFAVREVLEINREVKELIRRGDTSGIREYQERHGITMEHELLKAALVGEVSFDEARLNAPDQLYFNELLKARKGS